MTDALELIDAFADGERLTPEALRAALADPAARDYLVDLLELRGLVQAHVALDVPVAPPAPRASWSARSLWRAAAAIVILGAASFAGFAAGRHAEPPAAAAANTAAAVMAPAVSEPSVAPEPTRVIRFQPGVDWHQRAGGH